MDTTLIGIAHARLAEAESAYSAGDSDRHTAAAHAAAAIAQAAAAVAIAEKLAEIAASLADAAADDDEPSGHAAAQMAASLKRFGHGA